MTDTYNSTQYNFTKISILTSMKFYSKRIFWPPINILSQIWDFFYYYSQNYRTNPERSLMLYFFYFNSTQYNFTIISILTSMKFYSKRIFWPPISILKQIWDIFYYYSQNYRTNRERSLMLYFFILSKSSESSDYSCDFCQHNPKSEQLM